MKAVDTNILVRFLVKDDEKQAQVVYETFRKAETGKTRFWISDLVMLETIWVLESVYEISREEILDSIEGIISMSIFEFEAESYIENFLVMAHASNGDLSDLMIGCKAKSSGCDRVITFDKKATKSELFELIERN